MLQKSRRCVLLFCLLPVAIAASGCYVATIETGAAPSDTKIERKWAHGFLWGLVPPSVTEARSKCKSGVASVQTQHSFLNGLVAVITYGIYTPIQINVTCAKAGTAQVTDEGDIVRVRSIGYDDFMSAVSTAADRTVEEQKPILVAWHLTPK